MTDQYLCFSSEEGVDLYCKEESCTLYDHFWAPSAADLHLNVSDLVDESLLVKILNDYQCLETSDSIYIKSGDELTKYSKNECLANAVKHIVNGVDMRLRVENFVPMTQNQKSTLQTILSTILSQSNDIGKKIILPVVSEINYLKCSDYESDEVPWKFELQTDSPLWLEAIDMIHIDTPEPVSKQYTYSYVCKNILFR